MPPFIEFPSPSRRPLLLALALVAMAAGLGAALSMGWPDAPWLQARQQQLLALQEASSALFMFGFFVVFTLISALAIPGASVLALAAGVCFGFWCGTLVVVLASTCGAAASFLIARHFARTAVQRRFGAQLAPLERALARDGNLLLLVLRLAPVLPYFVVNPLMGLTRMKLRAFFVTSAIGMAPGSAAYVQAGTDIARWGQGGSLVSAELVLSSLTLLLLAVAARWWLRRRSELANAAVTVTPG
jgi:uncharacterized membrane protein YdjX (TVP38/TMEM64 family)